MSIDFFTNPSHTYMSQQHGISAVPLQPQLLTTGGNDPVTPAGLSALDRPIAKVSTVSRLLMSSTFGCGPAGVVRKVPPPPGVEPAFD